MTRNCQMVSDVCLKGFVLVVDIWMVLVLIVLLAILLVLVTTRR